jgi:hypothetical protein
MSSQPTRRGRPVVVPYSRPTFGGGRGGGGFVSAGLGAADRRVESAPAVESGQRLVKKRRKRTSRIFSPRSPKISVG